MNSDPESRPPFYKGIGIGLAIASGCFIGVSFVLKKVGLLKANEKYQEVAGEGYGYLKNVHWWSGMTLMIIGELCNFGAYAFTDAILITSLGALSVVISTILSAIFLKERLSMVGKVACFLCIVGAVIIAINSPAESAVADIQEMKSFVVTPGFLSYAGVIILGSAFAALYLGPRYGKKNMFTYISVCSWIGALSVVATQGLGAAIVAQIGGKAQFTNWFTYVVLVFVIATLLTEIVYLNKALNLFNAALVTPTYYVYFTSTTIITSSVLFQGFKGTPMQIVTVVMGFLTICAGVVLLQLSKSAKDVPDTAVFAGDLDQIQTIAEQEQSETEPKADAIRGTASIVRRFSMARQRVEEEEFRRMREEREAERLATVSEDGQPQFEWDGLRRRRTTMGSQLSSRPPPTPNTARAHPPLGMSHFPSYDELGEEDRDRPYTPGMLSSIAGTIRQRARSIVHPGHPDYQIESQNHPMAQQSPMHPVQLTEISVPNQSHGNPYGTPAGLEKLPYAGKHSATGSGASSRRIQIVDTPRRDTSSPSLHAPTPPPHQEGSAARRQFSFHNVFRRHHSEEEHDPMPAAPSRLLPHRPTVRTRGYSERQANQPGTEEERLGLVTGDSHSTSMPALPLYGDANDYDDDDEDDDDDSYDEKREEAMYAAAAQHQRTEQRYGRGITSSSSPPDRHRDETGLTDSEIAEYEASRHRWNAGVPGSPRDTSPQSFSSVSSSSSPPRTRRGGGAGSGSSPPRPPPTSRNSPPRRGGDGSYI